MIHFKSTDYHELYHLMLVSLLNNPEYKLEDGTHERIGMSMTLTNPAAHQMYNPIRKFNTYFAEKFFQWIWAGKHDARELIPANNRAEKYIDEVEGRNIAYGPRIIAQLPFVIDELKDVNLSRRAVINILDAEDKRILPALRLGTAKIEFPCTESIQFFIRNKKLEMYVVMRSNNMTLTVCYDVYNFCRMFDEVYKLLLAAMPWLEKGAYKHTIKSAHILGAEYDLASDIVEYWRNSDIS